MPRAQGATSPDLASPPATSPDLPQVASNPEPWNTLRIDYTCLGAPSRPRSPFTIENDRHLVCFALQVGYGRWDDLLREVRKSWLFKFDWYILTRTTAELGKRVEFLAKLIERDIESEMEAARKAKRVSKGGGGGGAKAGGKRGLDDDGAGPNKRRRE